jgi:hypothetical protein
MKEKSIHNDFLTSVQTAASSWRWPTYQNWLARDDWYQSAHRDFHSAEQPFWWKGLPDSLAKKIRSTSYIEWRYYSIVSDDFHGICGFSLFNPENHFAQASEGGLIVIIAGALNGAARILERSNLHDAAGQLERVQEFCFMHMFPMDSVIFHGSERQHLSASHQGLELRIDQVNLQMAEINLEIESALSLKFTHQAVNGCPVLAPVGGEDFRTIPGAHWTVFNPSPVATVSGVMTIRPGILNLSENTPGAVNPNFVSPPLAQRLYDGYVKIKLDNAAGYYEHSFGINPMPLHGWDFIFVPSPAQKAGLVLQCYRGSHHLTYLEVVWAESDGQWKSLRIPESSLKVEWTETDWHPALRVHVPRKRMIRAQYNGYSLEIENSVMGEIPFLRSHSPVVRHFFISEELSLTDWVLKDAAGRVCVEIKGALSGGETARGRWFYNLNGIFSLSGHKPF